MAASVSRPEPSPARSLVRLKRRPEFLAAARGRRASAEAFSLQTVERPGDADVAGVGFTVTRKIGGAVVRNRARRRLREAVAQLSPDHFVGGWNYVVVARAPALTCPFSQLRLDLEACLGRLRQGRPRGA